MSNSEIRLLTATIAALAAAIPAFYYFQTPQKQDSTQHVQTFHKLLAAYRTLRPQALIASVSPDFIHSVLPSDLQMPTRDLQSFKQHAAMIFSLFSDFSMVPQAQGGRDGVQFCRETNTVIAHCKMGGKVNGESEKGRILVEGGVEEWWTECVLFVRMDEGGRRIEEVREFVHSAKAQELQQRLQGILKD